MKKESILKKVMAGIGSTALAITLSACAHHDATADKGYGQIRTEAATTADSSNAVVGTAPAPNNAEGVGTSSTPAVISGPAAVDSTGRAYTSSSAGGSGNASSIGTNTNVNIIPKKTTSDVIVTQSPVENTPMVPAQPMVVETPAPAPAPVVVETPMASSTTETTTTTTKTTTKHHHHRKMHKD